MAKYYSTKTYGTDRGLSCCFRQWRANHSHCSLLHGYSIGIKLIFECDTLDEKNWCMDFGGLKGFKQWADYMFDHTLLIAEDDPKLDVFKALAAVNSYEALPQEEGLYVEDPQDIEPWRKGGLCDLRIVEGVGCEKFAEMAYRQMNVILTSMQNGMYGDRYQVNGGVRLKSVEVMEHSGNSAIYEG